jgi:hypothetical protein
MPEFISGERDDIEAAALPADERWGADKKPQKLAHRTSKAGN